MSTSSKTGEERNLLNTTNLSKRRLRQERRPRAAKSLLSSTMSWPSTGSETADEPPKCDKADNHKRGKAEKNDCYRIRRSMITILRYGIKSLQMH